MILTLVKALHIAALILWCAGLFALPLVLAKHDEGEAQADYARLRRITHYGYIRIVTPAAVIAIAAGTALIFLRGAFVPWMFAKLVAVGLLVALHAVIGHTVVQMSERRGEYVPPSAVPLLGATMAIMIAVLLLVLGKPVMPDLTPRWLDAPQHHQLPLGATPT
ncbi:CopD family protein [Sphingomonas faeni]|uniref:CopD family protein n=1 Tax=Sphingomonas faeni TaxID=185950 RepID=UPI00278296AB|nr:CopD family protein [Sphingomonas faeni]MDQ0836535.1 putative membrane protein [Sphingomonas faeni]